MNPLVSIIIPTYNRAHLIVETLDSILGQTYTSWECIIVDDGSSDNTTEVVQAYLDKDSRFQYHQRPEVKFKGANSCRNYGYELSRGEFINWFDSDDILKTYALETWLNHFTPSVDVVVAKVERFNQETHENNIKSVNIIEDYFIGKIAFYVCGPMWRRAFLEKQEILFDENITNLDDWDFNLRMLYRKPIIQNVSESLINYRVHKDSLSHEIGKLNYIEIRSEMNAREKHLRIISGSKIVDSNILKIYIKNRYKYFFREAMIQNHPQKKYFFMKLFYKQLSLFDIYGMLKSGIGFLVYSLINKGYMFLK